MQNRKTGVRGSARWRRRPQRASRPAWWGSRATHGRGRRDGGAGDGTGLVGGAGAGGWRLRAEQGDDEDVVFGALVAVGGDAAEDRRGPGGGRGAVGGDGADEPAEALRAQQVAVGVAGLAGAVGVGDDGVAGG